MATGVENSSGSRSRRRALALRSNRAARHAQYVHSLTLTGTHASHDVTHPRVPAEVTFHLRKGDEPDGGVTFQKLITPGTPPRAGSTRAQVHLTVPGGLITFHRADFQRVLFSRLAPHCRTHTSKRLVDFAQAARGPVQLRFQDGSRAECDVLVGADGIKSAVRARMLEHVAAQLRARGRHADADEALRAARPLWSGTMAYRTVVRTEDLQRRAPNHRVLTQPQIVRVHGTCRTLSTRI